MFLLAVASERSKSLLELAFEASERSKSLLEHAYFNSETLHCFELCFVRLHRRRKAPYANLVCIYIYS